MCRTAIGSKLGRMSTEHAGTPSPLERILAWATVAIIVVALGSFFATLIVGLNDRETLATGLWQLVYNISLIALPIGFVLLIALLVLSSRRRSREARAALETQGLRQAQASRRPRSGRGKN